MQRSSVFEKAYEFDVINYLQSRGVGVLGFKKICFGNDCPEYSVLRYYLKIKIGCLNLEDTLGELLDSFNVCVGCGDGSVILYSDVFCNVVYKAAYSLGKDAVYSARKSWFANWLKVANKYVRSIENRYGVVFNGISNKDRFKDVSFPLLEDISYDSINCINLL